MSLPIEDVLPEVRAALQARTAVVLQAPPGAGKTTRVPLALLEVPWLKDQKVVMLEPRRLAARAAARRMAQTLGERVGQTVGYRVRMDTRVSDRTRIEVVTEGVLTRMIQSDPALDGIGLVIFDEYHERSLHADLGLALCLESQAVLRPDLRILVMSATIEGSRVAALLEEAPVIASEGRSYPVETLYLDASPRGQVRSEQRPEALAAQAVRRALRETEGDVLVFLPGAGEIRRTEQRLQESKLPSGVDIAPLHGSLPLAEQDRAIAPGSAGRRKVVLATDIAETSLTIEGVRVVIDAGLMRVPRFDPGSGMTRLATLRVSKASADQRRGRAGRLGPGTCYRLWSLHTQQHLVPYSPPEILDADLAPLVLELARWGTPDPSVLHWLDPPPEAAYAQAQNLLRHLGALDAEGRITEHGRRMVDLPLHPRLAHMMLQARPLGLGGTACDLAALLSERDVFRSGTGGGLPDADLRLRLAALRDARLGRRHAPAFSTDYIVDRRAMRRVLKVADHWRRRFKLEADPDPEAAGLLLAYAYPDRIGQRRRGQHGGQASRYRLRNGRAATFAVSQLVAEADFLVAAHLDGRRRESLIFLAAPVDQDDLEAHVAGQIKTEEVIAWDQAAQRVVARRREQLGALVLKDAPLRAPDPEAVMQALLTGIRAEGLEVLPWTKKARHLRERLRFMHHHDATFPDVSDDALMQNLERWLGPYLYGKKRLADLQRLDLVQILQDLLTWEQRAVLDERAPTHLTVPSGSRIPIDYSEPEAPVLAVRLQELFGMTETPRIAGGRVALTLHLLSPAHRPVQVTQDLASFWKRTYFDVKKDLAGRYPKHYWPEDPLTAPPTNRAKPKR